MLSKIKSYYKGTDKIIFYSTAFSFFVALLIIVMLAFVYPNLPSRVPLFYSLAWGQPQMASLPQLLILPGVITLIALINMILSWHLHSSQLILKRIINLSSPLVALLLFISAIKIILIFI